MSLRVLCIGNELMGDDALGPRVAHDLAQLALPGIEVVRSSEAGIYLLPDLMGCRNLIIVDVVCSTTVPAGTLRRINGEDLLAAGAAPSHSAGLPEVLRLCRVLDLDLPSILLLTVEGADCYTVGAPMHPAVQAAIPKVISVIRSVSASLGRERPPDTGRQVDSNAGT